MEYINGFAKDEFLQYMYQEFPSVYNNSHSRELLENLVNYCIEEEFEGRLIDTLESLIPEVTHNEITRYFDNRPKEKVTITSLEELKRQECLKKQRDRHVNDGKLSKQIAYMEINEASKEKEHNKYHNHKDRLVRIVNNSVFQFYKLHYMYI